MVWFVKLAKIWNFLDLPQVGQNGQLLLVGFLGLIGTLGAVNKVLQLSMEVSSSFKETGFSVERAIDMVGKGSIPQIRWFGHAYATVNNITNAMLATVDHDMTRLIPATLCSL